jgi:hypothetical protein
MPRRSLSPDQYGRGGERLRSNNFMEELPTRRRPRHHQSSIISRRPLMLAGSTCVVALALESSLVKATTSYSSRRARIILRIGSNSVFSASANEYELLKRSRPFRIRARFIPTNDRRNDIVGSAETTKIVHFQRHAQGTQLFGRSAFSIHHGLVFPSRQSLHTTL